MAHMPLKQVMAQSMFRELPDRRQRVLGSKELQQRAADMGWKDATGWRFQVESKAEGFLELDKSRTPIPEIEMSNKLEHFVEHIKKDVVLRFHCTRRSN